MRNTIEIKCSGSEFLELKDLSSFQGKLKKISEKNRDRLVKSILKRGFIAPFFIWKNGLENKLMDGHQRLNALTWLKSQDYLIPPLPVVFIEAENEADAKSKLLAITSQYGEFDLSELNTWVLDLEDDIKDSLRFVDGELDLKISIDEDETVGDDEAPEVPETPETVLGDLWSLGDHRLLCGDSTLESDLAKLMGDEKADMLLTDPPYNVDYQGKTKDALKIENDKMTDDNFRQFLVDAFTCADMFMKPGAVFYIWHADSEGYNFRGACFDAGWKVRQCLIWNKNTIVMGRQDYHWKHEPCLYGWKDGAGHLWATDRKQSTVINFDKPQRNDIHPTMKPVDLFSYCMLNNTKGEDIILDDFNGSGTTIICAEKHGRKARTLELDPRYCDATVKRYAKFCKENNKPLTVKLNGEEYNGELLNG